MSNRKPGVYDSGAVALDWTEAQIALEWALTLKHVLVLNGFEVFLTRGDKADPNPVGSRAKEAEKAGCTHFISIHCNASNGRGTGTETYYRDAVDEAFGGLVQDAAVKSLGLKDRGLKSEKDSRHNRLAIFDFKGPACLLELGFIDHAVDRGRMLTRSVRIDFAERMVDVFRGLK